MDQQDIVTGMVLVWRSYTPSVPQGLGDGRWIVPSWAQGGHWWALRPRASVLPPGGADGGHVGTGSTADLPVSAVGSASRQQTGEQSGVSHPGAMRHSTRGTRPRRVGPAVETCRASRWLPPGTPGGGPAQRCPRLYPSVGPSCRGGTLDRTSCSTSCVDMSRSSPEEGCGIRDQRRSEG